MNVHVDGYRSTDENWLHAHRAPTDQLPAISGEQRQVAMDLGISAEDYARNLFAGNLTRSELQDRAARVGMLTSEWLRRNRPDCEVVGVWLKTFEGRFRVEVQSNKGTYLVFFLEQMIDDLLDRGSVDARQSFERVMGTNFMGMEQAVAL